MTDKIVRMMNRKVKSEKTLINVKDLSLGYDSHIILSSLNFTVGEGDYLCIVGENGSGKTTLMKTLLNLAHPVSGQIIMSEDLKQNEIGYLPQQTAAQKDFPASVREVVLSGLAGRLGKRPFYDRREKAYAMEKLREMGMSDYADKCYRKLSGGQQQRVLLARALCAARKLILLDEPVSGLDPSVTGQMYELIDRMNRESGIAVIMISHDLAGALPYAKHVLRMGDETFFGTRDEYISSGIPAGQAKGATEA